MPDAPVENGEDQGVTWPLTSGRATSLYRIQTPAVAIPLIIPEADKLPGSEDERRRCHCVGHGNLAGSNLCTASTNSLVGAWSSSAGFMPLRYLSKNASV